MSGEAWKTTLRNTLFEIEMAMKMDPDMPVDDKERNVRELIIGYYRLGDLEKSERFLKDAKRLFSHNEYQLFEQKIKEIKRRAKPPEGYYV